DSNTYTATKMKRPTVDAEVILPAENLHADMHGVALLKERLPKTDILVAIGSGTIHDIVRYCAAERGIPFVSAPTAATVDGFASSVAAMTWHGFKKTFPAVAPVLVLADLDVISAAPAHLALAGVGDILGKYICLADWKISHILTAEYYCDYIADLTRRAVDKIRDSADGLARHDATAFESLMYGLILSGVAMQLAGNSRPASGAEHHISHLLEMGVLQECSAMHGEKVGVAAPLCAAIYHNIAAIDDISDRVSAYSPLNDDWVKKQFGPLSNYILEENHNDCLVAVTPDALKLHWNKIRGILHSIPTQCELTAFLRGLGAKAVPEDIGLRRELVPSLISLSPLVRNRLTMMRILRMLKTDNLY
ncbi:MAG: sn-glycerol-1-phosphate dehydrogenase, partial [Acetanaerobacterium sp.]